MEDSVSGLAGQLGRRQEQRLLGVLADDFTGAADAALPFAKRGLPTAVCLGIEGLAAVPEQSQVVAVDLATRHLGAQEAAAAVWEAVDSLRDDGVRILYKKIDSTLRGNLGSEIEAALCACVATTAVVCPAFPAMGRTVVGGAVQVHGIDLLQTAGKADARSTVRSSRVADVLREQTSLPVQEVTRPDAAEILSRREKKIVVADALSDDDLDAWVREGGMPLRILWAGSAGLAAALSRALPEAKRATGPEQELTETNQALVLAGSAHPVTHRQIETLLCSIDAAGVPVTLPELFSDMVRPEVVVDRAAMALQGGRTCVVYVERGRRDEITPYSGAEAEIARRLAEIATHVQARVELCPTLVLTGGDTARAVLHRMGINCLMVAGAITPGIPVLHPVGRDLRIVTKAGGFGEPDALVRATQSATKEAKT